jgi:hypothetical protein
MKTLQHNLQFQHVPMGRGYHDRYLYAIELCNGVVKVGHTYQPRQRLRHHNLSFMRDGLRIRRFVIEPTQLRSHENERELLDRLRRLGRVLPDRLEMFEGVRFGQAVTLIKQIARREFVSLCKYSFGNAV